MKLTIAIPTYNRNKILKKNLILLLPQITSDCRILILDNCSETPVKETISDIINEFSHVDIRVIRNSYNLGLTGNILRCFEMCTDPWLWILGDDDHVKEGAIKQILNDIQNYKDNHFISYAWDEPSFQRKKDLITTGVDELIDSFESLGVILFISAGVYNIEKVISKLSYGNFFQTTYAPHLVILFMSLGDTGKSVLSSKQIVINKGFETPVHLRWDQIFFYQIIILLRLPLNPTTILKLRNRLVELTKLWTITHLIYTMVFSNYEDRDNKRPLVLYNDIVRSFFYLDKSITSRFIKLFGYIIVRYPRIFKPIMNFVYRSVKGRYFDPNNNLRI
jgi:glycosyltransferase involved in cell wall biosynthesis